MPAHATVTYVQGNSAVPQTPQTTVSVSYTTSQTAGDLNVVAVGWSDSTSSITSITDTQGNTYALAVGPTVSAGNATQSIYYAKNIAAGANTLTIVFDAAVAYPDVRIAEYSGIDPINALDVTAAASGNSASSSSGSVTTTFNFDLLVGANYVGTTTSGAGSGYTQRIITSPDGDILEDQLVTATGSYSATASLSSSGYWVMQLVAFRDYVVDTQPPSTPTGLTATATSGNQINLSWSASTDNVGVTGYRLERCQGSGCTNFIEVATPTATSYSDVGVLTPSTSYSYRVRAVDAATNLSGYSNTASATTSATGVSPGYAQSNSSVPQTPQTTVSATFISAQTVGNLNVVAVGWSDSTSAISSITDTRGNTYTLAVGPTVSSGNATQAIYYAKNIAASAAGTNTVTIVFNAAVAFPDVRIAEYAGIDTTNPLDVTAAAASNSASSSSGSVTTTHAQDMLIGANYVGSSTSGAGSGYTARVITSPDGDILEDQVVTTTGSYSATAPLASSDYWVMQLVAFKASPSGGGGDTQAPTAPSGLSATAVSGSQIDLSWTASTDNVGVTGYRVERCQGSGCSTFVQIATPTGTTFSDTGLSASTSYSYRVRATDAVPNFSGYSNTASVTTGAPGDTVAPSTPTGLSVIAASSNEIDVAWNASTDNVGVTGYAVERCQGAGCASWAQVATPIGTRFNDTARSASTSYSYRVSARDAANNISPPSSPVTYVTPASSPDCN